MTKPDTQIADEMAEVKKFIGLSDPATEALRRERAEMDRQRQATIQAKRAELQDLETSMTKVGREAESALRQGFKDLALYFTHARTRRKVIADINALSGERIHAVPEWDLIDTTSKWLGAQIRTLTGKMRDFGLLQYKLSTTMPPVDSPLFRERK